MKELTFAIEIITPAQAEEILTTRNENNRKIMPRRVDTYAALMKQGRWTLNHQAIAFGIDGDLIDGQHRLAACVRSEIDLKTAVARYHSVAVGNGAKLTCDTNAPRTNAQILTFSGHMSKHEATELTAALIAINVACGGDLHKYTPEKVADLLAEHGESARWALGALPGKRFSAPIRAAFAIAWRSYPEEIEQFAKLLVDGEAPKGSAAQTWFRSADNLRTNGGSAERRKVMMRALRIMKAHVTDEGDLSRLFTTDEGVQFFLAKRKKAGAK